MSQDKFCCLDVIICSQSKKKENLIENRSQNILVQNICKKEIFSKKIVILSLTLLLNYFCCTDVMDTLDKARVDVPAIITCTIKCFVIRKY